MLKKLSAISLLSILSVLALLYLGIEYWGSRTQSSSLRAELTNFTPGNISRIEIDYRGQEKTVLTKQGEQWEIELANGKKVSAQPDIVRNALSMLQSIQPSRLITRDTAAWKAYDVGGSGTRVTLFAGKNQVLDIVLGRFSPQFNGKVQSYVRLYAENDVYASDDFFSISFPSVAGAYRNNEIFACSPDSVQTLEFGPQNFALSRSAQGWMITANGKAPTVADSAAVAGYLSTLRSFRGERFADEQLEASQLPDAPHFHLITRQGGQADTLRIWKHEQLNYVLGSSQRPDALFSDEGDRFAKMIMKTAQDFRNRGK